MAGNSPDITESTAINERDHGPLLQVAAGFCAALMLLSLAARLQIRWPWKSLFGKDDLVAVVASAFALAQMIVVVAAVPKGFGKTSDDLSAAAVEKIKKAVYVSDILFVVAIFLAKLAVGFLYSRLSSAPRLARAAIALTIVPAVCTPLAVILVAVPTSGSQSWRYGEDARSGKIGCWIAVTTMSVLLEFGLLAFPIWLVKDLQMRRSPKVLIVLAAWLRLPLIPVSILRLLNITHTISSPDFTFDYTRTEIYTQVEMTYALINSTALCLHNFLRFANSGVTDITVGTGGAVTTLYGTGISSAGRSREHASSRQRHLKGFESVKLASLNKHSANAVHADSISVASDSSRRNIMVRHTVEVQYGAPDGASQRDVELQR